MSILQDIYNDNYSPEKAVKNMPFSLRLKERAFYDAIETEMGADFLEHHWDSLCKSRTFRASPIFRRGSAWGFPSCWSCCSAPMQKESQRRNRRRDS